MRCHRDVPASGESIDDTITLCGQLLVAHAGNATRLPESRPKRADRVDDHGTVAARIRVTGPDAIGRVLD